MAQQPSSPQSRSLWAGECSAPACCSQEKKWKPASDSSRQWEPTATQRVAIPIAKIVRQRRIGQSLRSRLATGQARRVPQAARRVTGFVPCPCSLGSPAPLPRRPDGGLSGAIPYQHRRYELERPVQACTSGGVGYPIASPAGVPGYRRGPGGWFDCLPIGLSFFPPGGFWC